MRCVDLLVIMSSVFPNQKRLSLVRGMLKLSRLQN